MAKAKGMVLGNPKTGEARKKAVAEIVDRADQRAANVIPIHSSHTAGGFEDHFDQLPTIVRHAAR